MQVGKTYVFDAAHFLPNHPKCGVPHGHTYHLTVMLWGDPDKNGMVIDFGRLDGIMKAILYKTVDHKYLNDILEVPTCENLGVYLKDIITQALEWPHTLHIRLQEGEGGWAEC